MATIKKKIWPQYFEAVRSGKKTFELRLNDFEVAEGDILVLEEWNPERQLYTGRSIEKRVGSIFKFQPNELPFWSAQDVKEKGLQIISLINE